MQVKGPKLNQKLFRSPPPRPNTGQEASRVEASPATPVDHLDEVRQRLVREGFAEAVRVPRFELRPSSPAAPPPRKQGVTAGCPAWAPSRGAIVSR